ncbi:MAG: aquaporin [Patescibacteria group bacterium]|jgi:glycerol uptake facilitator-like aquaporin|nr:aquaporin [Patescibacteria group bacterium]
MACLQFYATSRICNVIGNHKEIQFMKVKNTNIPLPALAGELVGTFVLAIIALTIGQPLLVGLTLVVLVLGLNVISGANLNPAVTFALWSVKKMDTVKALFYWLAQFIGGLFALYVTQLFKGGETQISLSSFSSFDARIVAAEVIGMAIFAFVLVSVVNRKAPEGVLASAIGLALMVGLYAGGGLLNLAAQNVSADAKSAPRVTKVDGAVLNPAIALAATEKEDQSSALQQQLGGSAKTTTPVSRLTLETTVGTLVGAALGANLFMLLAGESPFAKKKTVAEKVTTTIKKASKKVKGKK